MRTDLHNNIDPAQSIAAQGVSGGVNGSGVDLANFPETDVHLNVGSGSGDGDYSVKLQHAEDDGSGSPDTWEDVPSDEQQGSFTSNIDSGSDIMESVGYLGSRRHLRVVVTENTAGTTAPTVAATVVKGGARKKSV